MEKPPRVNARPPGTERAYRSLQERLKQMHEGLSDPKHAPREVMIRGKTLTSASVLARIEEVLRAYAAVTEALARVELAHLALRPQMPPMDALLRDLNDALRVYHGRENAQLLRYGLKPARKPRSMTHETAVLRSERARATRKLRGTLGPRQKAKIKGDVKVTAARRRSS